MSADKTGVINFKDEIVVYNLAEDGGMTANCWGKKRDVTDELAAAIRSDIQRQKDKLKGE